jgi:PEGA domain-containing protein
MKSALWLPLSIVVMLTALNSNAHPADSLAIPYNYINSIPQNAEVYYNDSLIGHTPFRTYNRLTYPGLIKIKYKGYNDYTYALHVTDTLLNKTFYLVSSLNSRGYGEELVTENKSSIFKKPRKILPIVAFSAASIGSAVSAYYFKRMANDKYDEYLQNGNQELLDKTKKYDLISGISLAVFQLGLVAVIYFLFID